jgi:hypothetical protein
VFGRAQELYPGIKPHAFFVLSTHITLLATVSDALELARFMAHVARNISDELGRLHDWPGALWERPYTAIPCVDEQSQIRRMAYVMAQGVKDGLVRHVGDWPGVHSTEALLSDMKQKGVWVDRTMAYRKRSKGQKVSSREVEQEKELRYEPLPVWSDLSPDAYRKKVRSLIRKAEKRSRELHPRVLGRRRILGQDPHARSNSLVRSPKPACHAVTSAARQRFLAAKRAFMDAYRQVFLGEWWKKSLPDLGVPCFAPSIQLAGAE